MAAAREHLAKHAEHGAEKSWAAHAPTLISQPSRERTMPETAPSKSWKACRNTSESLRKKGSGGGKKGQRRGKEDCGEEAGGRMAPVEQEHAAV